MGERLIQCKCGANDFEEVAEGKELRCNECGLYYLMLWDQPLQSSVNQSPRQTQYIEED